MIFSLIYHFVAEIWFCLALGTCTTVCKHLAHCLSQFFNNSKLWFYDYCRVYSTLLIHLLVCSQQKGKNVNRLCQWMIRGVHVLRARELYKWIVNLFLLAPLTECRFQRSITVWMPPLNTRRRFKVFLNFNGVIIYLALARNCSRDFEIIICISKTQNMDERVCVE